MRVKICGLTTPADAVRAAELGADAVGLNFYPKSKRHVGEAAAREIVRALPPFVTPVGLFVNRALADVAAWAAGFPGVRCLQIHADCHEVIADPAYQWVLAFPVRDRQSLLGVQEHVRRCCDHGHRPHAVLVDAHVPGEYGGTGRTAPWHLLADLECDAPLILAGGLTPDNVAEAVRLVRPYAVDVASGVEGEPGRKDFDKVRRFIDNARSACG